MPLRGLGPKGARVGHSVCIVRQVLSRGEEYFGFDVHGKDHSDLVYVAKVFLA